MKKIILIAIFSFVTMSFISVEDVNTIKETKIENVKCKFRQCNATAKSTGKRCKHCVSKKEDYQCYQHKPKKKK